MKSISRLKLVLFLGLYVVIGIALAVTTVDHQVTPVDWGRLFREFPESIGEILALIAVRGIIPVLFWPFRFLL